MSKQQLFILASLCISVVAVLVYYHLRMDRWLAGRGVVPALLIAAFTGMAVFVIWIYKFEFGDAYGFYQPQAEGVLAGKLPYRDIDVRYGFLFPYYNAAWLKLLGRREGIILGLVAAYVVGILVYWQFRLKPLAGSQAALLAIPLVFSPISWFLSGCKGQDETIMVLALCVGLALVDRAHWKWVALVAALGLLFSKLTFAPIALGLTLATARPVRCLGLMLGVLAAFGAALLTAGVNPLYGLQAESGTEIMGANLLSLVTLLPWTAVAEALRKPSLATGALAILGGYGWWLWRLRSTSAQTRGQLAEVLVFSLYLPLLLFSHKALPDYRIPVFLTTACWFATAGEWTSIRTPRMHACLVYSLLVGLYAPLWEKWIYVLPYCDVWLPAGQRPLVPGTTVPLSPVTAGIMYLATIVILVMEIAALRILLRDAGKSATIAWHKGFAQRDG